MLSWAPYPFVRVALSFIAGILLYLFAGKDFQYSTEVLAFFVLLYLVGFLLSKRRKQRFITDVAGVLGLLSFVALGLWTTHLHTEKHQPQHLLHLSGQPNYYQGVVDDYVLQKPGYQSTVLKVEQVLVSGAWQKVSGKVQLSVPHDSERPYELNYGDVLLIKGAPQKVSPPLNPAQFDYQQYLANKSIYHRHYLQAYQYEKVASEPANPLLYASIQLRRNLDALLRAHVGEKREYSISSALLLGVKDELDNAIRETYASTGTMHVLAVSGLHVGLIYLLLMLVLRRFGSSKAQRLLGAGIVLAALWLYAFVTGLTPSVLRAVVMFSLVTVGLAIQRRTNIYNTVAIAAVALLLLNPYNLLEVGFQLSFLAVLGIVYLQPRFYNLLEVDNWLLDKVWAYFTVAVAAQIATLPLGLFYFHQFPAYFWLANLVVVPLATFVLWSGIAALAFVWVPMLGALLFQVHYWLLWGMNEFNFWVQQLSASLLQGIDITLLQTILLYLLLFALVFFLALKKLRFLSLAVVIVAILSVQEIKETVQQKNQELLALYQVRGSTGMALVQGQQATVLSDSILLLDRDNYTFNIQPHLWQLGVHEPKQVSLPGNAANAVSEAALTVLPDSNQVLVWQGIRLLLLSRPPQLKARQSLNLDYVLLRQNVRLKPEDLQGYTTATVLLDASSAPWYRRRLHQALDTLGLAYYDVADSGAFVLKVR
ncbi:competence protein ComEC [Pontibacter ummariensis]|uniref:Competence protein ComEC n=1 Tax=Pontibacter ummariensis TaxID=1610492 RepID=A0A239J4Z3_9BACT|nr:ComEC/Rec2 family competence protein [Pontibacter ummariensis]PRY08882.1 competence protein ComEC [Pontibacter ummariensis]SNT00859.1 competence protein ComEC [Pontibacter ummariensis]